MIDPVVLDLTTSLILCAAAIATAAVSAILGMAGGSMLLAVMLLYLDPITAIPIHGIVQLTSNGNRTIIHAKSLRRDLLIPFALMTLPAGLLTLPLAQHAPAEALRLVIGLFVLVATWKSRWLLLGIDPTRLPERPRFALLGAATGALSPIIGATGPFIAPFFLGMNLTRFELIGTKAACQAATHLSKIVLFGIAGFAFIDYLPLVAGMAVSVVIGTMLGTRVLHKIDDDRFVKLYKIALTAVAARLILSSLT